MKQTAVFFFCLLAAALFSGTLPAEEETELTWNEQAMEALENPETHSKVLPLLRKGMETGDADAILNLAGLTAQGKLGLKPDEKEAFRLFSLAAEKGSSIAKLNLGLAYYYGKGTAKDEKKAAVFLEEAAKAGESEAAYILGNLAEKNKDSEKAKQYYLQAGNKHLKALNRLGILTYFGNGEKSGEQALTYFLKAGFQDYAPAQNNVAFVLTHSRENKAPDWKTAIIWYQKAAEQNNATAMFHLGNIYFGAAGADFLDAVKAVEYLKKAAAQGHAGSLYLLGTAYRLGDGAEQNTAKAMEYYKRAAEKGYLFACIQLAEMYAERKEEKQAAFWNRKAEELMTPSAGTVNPDTMQDAPVRK